VIPDLLGKADKGSMPTQKEEEKVASTIDKVKVSKDLTNKQKHALRTLLSEFEDVFKTQACAETRTDAPMHRIRLKPDSKPACSTPYSYAPKVLEDLRKFLDKLLEQGMISPGEGPWAAPVVMVRKPCGSWRMCIDYRRLNELTVKDKFPLPRIQDLHHSLRGSSWFSSMDAMSGFYQIIMDPRDRAKTGFITKFGLFQWNVMPMGLANAPSAFQRFMQQVLSNKGGLHRFSMVYVDDIIVHSTTFEGHLAHLRAVLTKLRKHNVALKATKCFFGFRELKFLGFVANGGGIRADPEKVKALQEFKPPRTLKELQRFLGAANWLRDTVANFAAIAAPLYEVQKKDSKSKTKRNKIVWQPKHQAAFDAIKSAVAAQTLLHHPDFEKEFHVDVDASDVGIGAVLYQLGNNNEKRPIVFVSKALSAAQLKWKTAEKEAFASIWALKEKLRPFLVGQKFTLHTDHANLRYVLRQKKGKLARWGLILSEFLDDMEIVHKPGKDNALADALSRDPCETGQNTIKDVAAMPAIVQDNLRQLQLEDPRWGDVIRFIERKALPDDSRLHDKVKRTAETCVVDSKGVLRCTEAASFKHHGAPEPPVCVPQSRVRAVLNEFHTQTHDGTRRMHFDVSRRFFWPGLRRDVVRHVRDCVECQKAKATRARRRSVICPKTFVAPWDVMGIDLFGPLPKTKRGHTNVLTIVDTFTRFTMFIPLKQATALELCDTLMDRVFPIFGFPKRILSDNGSQFVSDRFRQLCHRLGIRTVTTLPFHPQGNGTTERVHRLLKSRLRIQLKTHGKQWDDWLGSIALAHNQGILATTDFTPFQLTFGRQPNFFPSDLTNHLPDQAMDLHLFGRDLTSMLQESWKQAALDMKWTKERMTSAANAPKAQRRPSDFKIGDRVLLHRPLKSDAATQVAQKLRHAWTGPFVVTAKIGMDGYELQSEAHPHRKKKRAHADDIAPFKSKLPTVQQAQPAAQSATQPVAEELILVRTPQGAHVAKVLVEPDVDERHIHVQWFNTSSRRSLPLEARTWKPSWTDPQDGKSIFTVRPPKSYEPERAMVEKEDVLLRNVVLTRKGTMNQDSARATRLLQL